MDLVPSIRLVCKVFQTMDLVSAPAKFGNGRIVLNSTQLERSSSENGTFADKVEGGGENKRIGRGGWRFGNSRRQCR